MVGEKGVDWTLLDGTEIRLLVVYVSSCNRVDDILIGVDMWKDMLVAAWEVIVDSNGVWDIIGLEKFTLELVSILKTVCKRSICYNSSIFMAKSSNFVLQ